MRRHLALMVGAATALAASTGARYAALQSNSEEDAPLHEPHADVGRSSCCIAGPGFGRGSGSGGYSAAIGETNATALHHQQDGIASIGDGMTSIGRLTGSSVGPDGAPSNHAANDPYEGWGIHDGGGGRKLATDFVNAI